MRTRRNLAGVVLTVALVLMGNCNGDDGPRGPVRQPPASPIETIELR